jgi:hypothetical protein
MDFVEATSFYQDAGDKIKLNWFCYEYANNIYLFIQRSKGLARYVKEHPAEDVAAFCLYFAKRMKKSIHEMQVGETEGVLFHTRYVFEFYPTIPEKQIVALCRAGMDAWDDQMAACSGCPNRCLADGYDLCAMFDALRDTGWPT